MLEDGPMGVDTINGTELWWDAVGPADGPVVLMLHGGLGFDHTYFRPLFDRLARGGRRVVYVDQRGNGRSGRPPLDTITMEQLADDAAALLETVGAPGPAVVIGHSYGTFVAQELALRHTGVVAGLVLLGATPGQLGTGESGAEERQGPPPPPELQELMSTFPTDDDEFAAMAPKLMPWYFAQRSADEVAEITAHTILSRDAMVRSMEVLGGWSSVDRLGSISVPVLLMVGGQDLFCSPPQSLRIASRVPDAEVVVLEDSGHMLFHDEPDPFFHVLEDWLARKVPVG